MATINVIGSSKPIEVAKGGTGLATNTTYAVLIGGTTATGSLQNITLGSSGDVFSSGGAGAVPFFTTQLPTFFETLAADPGSPTAGDVWYNTTSDLFKGAIFATVAGFWTVKATISSARGINAATGNKDDALCFGGTTGTITGICQRYTGSTDTWASKQSLTIAAMRLAGGGTASDALQVCGYYSGSKQKIVYLYDGGADTWTSKAQPGTSKDNHGATGTTSSDVLEFGGGGGADQVITERFNGTAWTVKGDLPSSTIYPSAAGEAGNALCINGDVNATYRYDGSGDSWSTKTAMSAQRRSPGAGGGTGSTSNALCWNGFNAGNKSDSEEYDGSANTWASSASTNLAKSWAGDCGFSTDDCLTAGGSVSGGYTDETEIFGTQAISIKTFTVT